MAGDVVGTLFLGNLAYNVALAVVITLVFRGDAHFAARGGGSPPAGEGIRRRTRSRRGFDSIRCARCSRSPASRGGPRLRPQHRLRRAHRRCGAAPVLPGVERRGRAADRLERGAARLRDRHVCGGAAALRHGGRGRPFDRGMATPLVTALLLCVVGAVTSAFASSAGILGALIPLAVPLMAQGAIGTTGLVVALAISATVVDATPFSTVGALVVANAEDDERAYVYRGLLAWGAVMVITAPLVTWLLFILPSVLLANEVAAHEDHAARNRHARAVARAAELGLPVRGRRRPDRDGPRPGAHHRLLESGHRAVRGDATRSSATCTTTTAWTTRASCCSAGTWARTAFPT